MLIFIPILKLLISIIDLYTFFLTVWVVLSLLIHFNIVNSFNDFVKTVQRFLDSLVEPILNKIRLILPLLGSIDLSPLALYLSLGFIKNLFIQVLISMPI